MWSVTLLCVEHSLAAHDHRGRAKSSKGFLWAHKLSNAIAACLCPPFPLALHISGLSVIFPVLGPLYRLSHLCGCLPITTCQLSLSYPSGKQGCLVVSTFISFYFAHGTHHYLILEWLLLLLPDTTKDYLRGTT